MRGKNDKRGNFENKQFQESNNLFNLEKSIQMLSMNINQSLHPLPNYDKIKTSPKGMKFGTSQRFNTQKDFNPSYSNFGDTTNTYINEEYSNTGKDNNRVF